MAKKLYEESSVQDIAVAIREKNGTATISGGYLTSLVVPSYSGKTVAFARFGCYWIDAHSVITVNEEIQ